MKLISFFFFKICVFYTKTLSAKKCRAQYFESYRESKPRVRCIIDAKTEQINYKLELINEKTNKKQILKLNKKMKKSNLTEIFKQINKPFQVIFSAKSMHFHEEKHYQVSLQVMKE